MKSGRGSDKEKQRGTGEGKRRWIEEDGFKVVGRKKAGRDK